MIEIVLPRPDGYCAFYKKQCIGVLCSVTPEPEKCIHLDNNSAGDKHKKNNHKMAKSKKSQNHMKELVSMLKKDKAYWMAWSANIAMSYMDAHSRYVKMTGKKYLNHQDRHIIANQAAEDFLNLLCS